MKDKALMEFSATERVKQAEESSMAGIYHNIFACYFSSVDSIEGRRATPAAACTMYAVKHTVPNAPNKLTSRYKHPTHQTRSRDHTTLGFPRHSGQKPSDVLPHPGAKLCMPHSAAGHGLVRRVVGTS